MNKPREVDINSVEAGQVVGQKLEWDNVDNALEAVHNLRNTDGFVFIRDTNVVGVTDNDGSSLSGCDLLQS
jgi:hypothetical protein